MPHSFAEFTAIVVEQLDVDDDAPRDPTTGLYEDWSLDSLQSFQLIVLVEAMAGALVPPAVLPEMFTVGDAYDYYLALVSEVART